MCKLGVARVVVVTSYPRRRMLMLLVKVLHVCCVGGSRSGRTVRVA